MKCFRFPWLPLLAVALSQALLACDQLGLPGSSGVEPESPEDSEESGGAEEREEQEYEAEDGSCNDWKISYCEAVVECANISRDECELDIGYLRCLEEAPFGACQQTIDAALENDDCDAIPGECSPSQIADRSVPTQMCRDIYYAMCEADYLCLNTTSIESCTASLLLGTPCDQFTAVLPEAEQCLEGIRVKACGDAIPNICFEIFRY